MTTADELQALVEQRYALLDAPSWDAAYDWEDSSPPDEAYSRVTDPDRYRIIHLRSRVWAEVLAERLDVRREPLGSYDDPEHDYRRVLDGSRLVPSAPGARPLLLVEVEVADGDGPPLPALDVVLDRPGLVVGGWPDCGCDACDTGSADLLAAVDDSILTVVVGPYAMIRGHDWTAEWHPDGEGADGGPHDDLDRRTELARRLAHGEPVKLPPGTDHVVSRSWLG